MEISPKVLLLEFLLSFFGNSSKNSLWNSSRNSYENSSRGSYGSIFRSILLESLEEVIRKKHFEFLQELLRELKFFSRRTGVPPEVANAIPPGVPTEITPRSSTLFSRSFHGDLNISSYSGDATRSQYGDSPRSCCGDFAKVPTGIPGSVNSEDPQLGVLEIFSRVHPAVFPDIHREFS